MRFASIAALLATGTFLSGCATSQLDAVGNLSAGCSAAAALLDCSGPLGAVKPPVTAVTPAAPTPNTGNNSGLTAGDATLALESSNLVSTAASPALSTLAGPTVDPVTGLIVLGTQATLDINPNTVDKAAWPTKKVMDEWAPGTAVGSGIGGSYKEYRAYAKNAAGTSVDEELQVWNWGQSYGTQYRDVTGGGTDAIHQAWSFGGNYTTVAAMPTSGTADYSGKYTATAKTTGFIDSADPEQTISWNNLWTVTGDSNIHADFGGGTVTGTLTPQHWIGEYKTGSGRGDATLPAYTDPVTGAVSYANLAPVFMKTDVVLKGTISTATKDPLRPNAVTGTAVMDPAKPWLNSSTESPMAAGFFGANADQVTGVFSLDATTPYPYGGQTGIVDDRRAYIQMSGLFNACKTGPVCP